MRKSHWISFGLALAIAAGMASLERERRIYFLAPRIQSVSVGNSDAEPLPQNAGYALGRWMQRAEWSMSDLRFKLRGARPANPDVVIIGIDEKSLQQSGQWPWPRSIHAELIDILSKAPPKALLFDVLFLEPFTDNLAGDRALVQATKRNPWVVHSLFLNVNGNKIAGGKLPFDALAQVSSHLASVNALPDEDGVLRSAPLQLDVEGLPIPLLALEGASLYEGKTRGELVASVPKDGRGEMLVQFAGPEYSFKVLPYIDILKGRISPKAWADKIALVGSLATGTYDHYPTPLSADMPGVEFHATIIDNLISRSAMRSPGIRATYLMIALAALIGGVLFARVSAGAGFLWMLLLAASFLAAAQTAFTRRHLLVDTAGPLFTFVVSYMAIVIYRFFSEEREKRLVKSFFSQQVSGELLDVLMENPDILKKAGERREMTVFFSDVAGFTSISERLRPEELVELLNQYLTSMTDVIFENGGYVDKYMGDGIMAFWNGLLKQADHAERACRCALQSKKRLVVLNEDLKKRGLVPLGARIGINTGEMAAGYMGSVQKKQFTVMGDNVNLGSRLEGANKAFGSSIMISEFTYDMIRDKFDIRFLDRILVPGKAKPVRVYELLAEKGQLEEKWQKALPIYHDAIQLFTDRQWSKAREKFLEVEPILGQDKACMAYVHRAEAFMAAPPAAEWDGVFEVKSK